MPKGQTRVTVAAVVARLRPEWGPDDVGAAIAEGRVLVEGRSLTNPAARVLPSAPIRILEPPDLAGRRKLGWALSRFDVSAAGAVALDVGASTGGFTTAWLEAGAIRVYAVDVGYGQLLGSLRQDPRVVNLERTNVADLVLSDAVEMVSVDVSYLALGAAVGQLDRVAFSPGAQLLGLVKPMFELRLPTIPSDPVVLGQARDTACTAIAAAGWTVLGADECPVRGGRGAIEFVVHARRSD